MIAMVTDRLTDEVRQESQGTIMFADDIIICSESKEQLEENLEWWRYILGRRGMKVIYSKAEHTCVSEGHKRGVVRSQRIRIKKVEDFRHFWLNRITEKVIKRS